MGSEGPGALEYKQRHSVVGARNIVGAIRYSSCNTTRMLGPSQMVTDRMRNKFTRIVFTSLLFAIAFLTLASSFYIGFRYSVVMPRSPQPETGRIYPMRFKGAGTVYVNRDELGRSDFVEYRLMPLFAVTMMLYFGVGTRLGWWPISPKKPFAKL